MPLHRLRIYQKKPTRSFITIDEFDLIGIAGLEDTCGGGERECPISGIGGGGGGGSCIWAARGCFKDQQNERLEKVLNSK